MNKGLTIVISAPSGGGKGTILKELFQRNKNLQYSISATTRNPRAGEVEGVHYRFLKKDAFQRLIDQGEMLEYAEYCEHYYGTPREPVEQATAKGFDVVLEIEVQGGAQVKKLAPDCVSIFIAPPSMAVLEQRLRDRGTENEATVLKRLDTARQELLVVNKYDYIVINDTVEKAVEQLQAIITAEKLKTSRNAATIERIQTLC